MKKIDEPKVKKLKLEKETITRLNNFEMNNLIGGNVAPEAPATVMESCAPNGPCK